MAVTISYMGAKHDLAPVVAEHVRGLPAGPCLDVFAGLCSVAGALASSGRESWCNDVQQYSAAIAQALLTSQEEKIHSSHAAGTLFDPYRHNLELLKNRFRTELATEAAALADDDWTHYSGVAETWRHAGNDEAVAHEIDDLREQRAERTPYRLCALSFAHGFFGLRQSLEVDSLRYAIDISRQTEQLSGEQARWCLVALLQTASRIKTAPGHFAQFLRVHAGTYHRIKRQRLRSVWAEFLIDLDRLAPFGSAAWRSGNRAYCGEALVLLRSMADSTTRPAVVYADPPYSKDQYSRYYHVLETLIRYDYPSAIGEGRYRPDRFHTPFSRRSGVADAFRELAAAASAVGASVLLNYPTDGILFAAEGDPVVLLQNHYRDVRIVWSRDANHSTLGASHGRARTETRELLIAAQGPKI